ncbi:MULTISPECIES: dihydrodipicolinate synthase family protein [unclassified Brevibacterium]|uniref:dihydrodipicolinate synthase family protein n=1 Tax=unclassified Brevibacterium TaxID=2614124 RepID=UPI0010F54702|nr:MULTISPECIES: dihydrodipicolinate synthase family protein [unclassified Brevibacterium]MCM1011289.1 dihydrodipicolinate synthase family protein [Brevibacterium sp. XM4083]
MMQTQFTGVLAAVLTPFTPDACAVDHDGIGRQVEHIIAGGVGGLVPGGSTGEFTALSTIERKAVNRSYIEAAGGRVPVIAGTGALNTAETIDLTRDAADAGAAAAMIVPPFYDVLSFPELVAHYSAITDAVDIPIMYYNIPGATGVELSPTEFAELGRKTGITCFKDTGGDFPKLTSVHFDHAGDITALNGWDTLSFAAFALGARAGVWGAASVIPRLCADLYRALVIDRDLDRGRALWALINPICVFLEAHNYAGAIKAGVRLVGVDAGPTRRPILPLAEADVEEFRGLLQRAGVEVVG